MIYLHVCIEFLGKVLAGVAVAWLQHKLAKRRMRAPQLGTLPAPQPLRKQRRRGRRAEQAVPT